MAAPVVNAEAMWDNKIVPDTEVHVELDLGNLCVSKIVELKPDEKKNQGEEWLKCLATRGAQLLINSIWELPTEFHDHVVCAKLPQPSIIIPREKPVPKNKPPSRWDKFAKTKGITKKKKEKLLWDDRTKEWKPQYGYRSIKNDKSDWLIEVPHNADPNADYYAIKKGEKDERVAKNEYQRLRNIAVENKLKVTNLESVDQANKEQLSRSLSAAKTSTASMGKFTKRLSKEKPPKNTMKKRKFEANIPNSMKAEKENSLKILDDINKKKPKLDIAEAVELNVKQRQKSSKSGQKSKKRNNSDRNNKGGKRRNSTPGKPNSMPGKRKNPRKPVFKKGK